MIEVEGLVKSYAERRAVDGVSFTAADGEVFGLLGPNGAGKSTTLGCLYGLLQADAGQIRIDGFDLRTEGRQARARLGVVPQEMALYPDLSAAENLRFWGGCYSLRGAELTRGVETALERVGLSDRAAERVGRLSGGMRRRLNLAAGLVHGPSVLLLDEPTAGVDPQSRARILELVRKLADEGACVVYTTHYMEEAETLCDRLAVMDAGRLLVEGTLAQLAEQSGEADRVRLEGVFDESACRGALVQIAGLEIQSVDATTLQLKLRDAARSLAQLLGALDGADQEVRETRVVRPSLETLFLELTGRELRA